MQKSLLIILLSTSLFASAQAPQAINYQAIARTNSGSVISSQAINIRFSILEGSASGTTIYQESHQATTNSFGLFIVAIGKGTPITGTFGAINWGSGQDKYLKVEMAIDGTNNYQLQGTTQLLSVPYALYAEKTNLIAGNGISINGNTIASTSANQWLNHSNGIYRLGKVGVGATPHSIVPLTVYLPNNGNGTAILHLKSNDTWHSAMTIFNGDDGSPNQKLFSVIVTGPLNGDALPGTFGVLNHQTSTWGFNLHPTTNNMAVGSTALWKATAARSRLHVFAGDVNIDQIGSGIIMKSPNGNCWRITIDDSGNLVRTPIACP